MRCTILGSGTLISGPERKPSSFLLESGSDIAILDLGPGILYQLLNIPVDPLEIKTIFITHFHLDHCADVFPFLMYRYLLDPNSNRDVHIYGPEDIVNWFNTIASTQGSWLHNCPPVVRPVRKMEWGGYKIETQPNKHTETSIAFRFTADHKYFFSSDTGFNEDLIEFASDSDVGYLECSYPDEEKKHQHLTPLEVDLFASQARLKKIVVVHMYPSNDKPDLKDRIRKTFHGEIIIGKDFQIIE